MPGSNEQPQSVGGDGLLVALLPVALLGIGLLAFDLFFLDVNRILLDPSIVFTDDLAATALRVSDARRFREAYGTPSWNEYLHPGPALMYWRALFETLSGLLRADIGHPAVHFVAHLVFLNAVVGAMFLLVRRMPDVSTRGAVIFTSLFAAFPLATPTSLSSLWEPEVSALLYAAFAVTAATASFGSPALVAAAILLGAFCIHVHIALAHAVVLTLLAVAVLGLRPFVARSRARPARSIGLVAGAAAIGAAPLVYDVVFAGAQNLGRYLAFADKNAGAPRPSLARALDVVAIKATIPPTLVAGLVVLALVWALATIRRTGAPAAPTDTGATARSADHALARLVVVATLGLVAAVLFQRVSATAGYAPPHATAYVFAATALLVAALGTQFAMRTGPGLVATLAALALPLAIVLVTIDAKGRIAYRTQIVPQSLFVAPDLHQLARDAAAAARDTRQPIRVTVTFPYRGEAFAPEYMELPWRMAVGLMNLLRRADVPYCVGPSRHRDHDHAYAIMRLMGKTGACPAEGPLPEATFTCRDGNARAQFGSRSYVFTKCP